MFFRIAYQRQESNFLDVCQVMWKSIISLGGDLMKLKRFYFLQILLFLKSCSYIYFIDGIRWQEILFEEGYYSTKHLIRLQKNLVDTFT